MTKRTLHGPKITARGRLRRRSAPRSKTLAIKRLLVEIEHHRGEQVDQLPPRPRTRGDCLDGPRPCPWVSCRYHLYIDVNPAIGSLTLNFPDLEAWETPATCALDLADEGGLILEDCGAAMNITRERVRQIEAKVLARLRDAIDRELLE